MLSGDMAVPIQWHDPSARNRAAHPPRSHRKEAMQRIGELLAGDAGLAARFARVSAYQRGIRASEYHLTNACNIRCKGCWFFEAGLDKTSREESDPAAIEAFVLKETTQRRINTALVIGGEPTLVPRRLAHFVKHMRHVSISTNGLRKLPVEGFEDVGIAVTLFGGGPMDDELRAIKPGGKRFEGLFDTALGNYRDDRRVLFVFAVTESGVEHVEPTVRKIRDNGNRVIFNFYSDYGAAEPIADMPRQELLEELLRVRSLYPATVRSHPYFIRTMVTGQAHWAAFGYDNCPSISRDHPAHAARLANGNPSLPLFNTWAADMRSVTFCCTSGRCDGCRDSQAMTTWLVMNAHQFAGSIDLVRTWVELAEMYWEQFCWSPYHPVPAVPATSQPLNQFEEAAA